MGRLLPGLALAGLGGLALLVGYLVAGPVLDNDVWWHLAHGRAFLESGPWLESDPCLGTAERGPIPHSWLFDAGAAAIEDVAGLHGLRAAHALVCLAIGWLAFGLARRESGGLAPAAAATAVFGVLVWYRLVQVRPEVLSIAFTLLLHRWLLGPAPPSWRSVAAIVAMVALWANVHALFALGPLLMAAALAGLAARIGAARLGGLDAGDDLRRAGRVAATLGLSLLASLANPRGIAQHLAYLESAGAGAIQLVTDEWAPFDPTGRANAEPAVSALSLVLTDALLVAFLAVAAVAAWRFLRRPSAERLAAADPLRLALGVAGCVALLTAVRFLWLGWLPLLFLAHAMGRSERRGAIAWDAGLAAVAILLAVLFVPFGGFGAVAAHYPAGLGAWLTTAHTGGRFFDVGVRFLAESGVRGQVFNDYALGGYLCHRAGPAVRTFVDGSMNFPDAVSVDYGNALRGGGSRPGESLSELLDRRGVDLFFGFGVPADDAGPDSSAALAGHPDWRLVSRSWRHGIYLRAGPRNAENLARIERWYAEQGVPFDPERGFDPGRVLRERPDWAAAWEMWPAAWLQLLDGEPARGLKARVQELETLGLGYLLVGAWPEEVRTDRRAAALRPRAKAPRRRLVAGLLRLGRVEAARGRARELVALDPSDERSARFAEAVRRFATAPSVDARLRAVDALPILRSRQPLRQ